LLAAAGILATFLPREFQLVLTVYYALTIAYSFALKGIVLADVLTLAGLYTLRVVAGTYAVNVPLSFWLLWFSMFLFLSLAFLKRYAELEALNRQQQRLTRPAKLGDHSWILERGGHGALYKFAGNRCSLSPIGNHLVAVRTSAVLD
jgi:4-hydroxybenzoate polyprenyltransferase